MDVRIPELFRDRRFFAGAWHIVYERRVRDESLEIVCLSNESCVVIQASADCRQGLFADLLAVVVYFVLPDYPKSPCTSKWLNAHEQEYLEVRTSETHR